MKPGASLPRVFGKMRADTAPFIVGQIRGISLAVHGAKLRPPSRSPSTFQTVSRSRILRSWTSVLRSSRSSDARFWIRPRNTPAQGYRAGPIHSRGGGYYLRLDAYAPLWMLPADANSCPRHPARQT